MSEGGRTPSKRRGEKKPLGSLHERKQAGGRKLYLYMCSSRRFDSCLWRNTEAVPSEDVLELQLIRYDNVSLVEADYNFDFES